MDCSRRGSLSLLQCWTEPNAWVQDFGGIYLAGWLLYGRAAQVLEAFHQYQRCDGDDGSLSAKLRSSVTFDTGKGRNGHSIRNLFERGG